MRFRWHRQTKTAEKRQHPELFRPAEQLTSVKRVRLLYVGGKALPACVHLLRGTKLGSIRRLTRRELGLVGFGLRFPMAHVVG